MEIDPSLVVQVTAVLVEPLTVAVNCWVPAEEMVGEEGEMETDTDGGSMVTVVEAESAVLA